MLEGLETEDVYSFTRLGIFFFMKREGNFCVAAACAGQLQTISKNCCENLYSYSQQAVNFCFFPVQSWAVCSLLLYRDLISWNLLSLQYLIVHLGYLIKEKYVFLLFLLMCNRNLSNNKITDIEEGAFDGASGVNELLLTSNRLETVRDKMFKGLESLKTL